MFLTEVSSSKNMKWKLFFSIEAKRFQKMINFLFYKQKPERKIRSALTLLENPLYSESNSCKTNTYALTRSALVSTFTKSSSVTSAKQVKSFSSRKPSNP